MMPAVVNVLELSPAVVQRIRAEGSALDVTLLRIGRTLRFNIFVDDVLVDHVDHQITRRVSVNPPVRCQTASH